MATNAPTGDGHRNGAVRKRTQLKTEVMGEEHFTKRSKTNGQFVAQKKMTPSLKASVKKKRINTCKKSLPQPVTRTTAWLMQRGRPTLLAPPTPTFSARSVMTGLTNRTSCPTGQMLLGPAVGPANKRKHGVPVRA